LVVELETPTPYFLELLATHFFYPFHPKSKPEKPIVNGPFQVQQWKKQNEFIAVKNPNYWNAHDVRLDGIIALVLDEQTALRMFENKELDWAGSPLSTLPQDAIPTLKHRKQLHVNPAAGTHWFRFNTEKAPFNNQKMREAFTMALDRKAIVEHITQGGQKPAQAIVPPSLGLKSHYFEDKDIPKAWYAFQDALEELKISKDEFPEVTLCYGMSERNHKIAQAVQQQWNKTFGIQVKLEHCESQVFFQNLKQGTFQIANGSWFADFRDPTNFLEIFKLKSNATNHTRWENPRYIELLNESSSESDREKRMQLLADAQQILMNELPVAPLFFCTFNFVKNEDLLGVYFSDLGYVDFKYSFFGN
jgi:oligopeptide transport system substrate-binding protein